MLTYIVLGHLTAQSKRNPAESLKARDQLFADFEKKGMKITAYSTIGPYDVVNLVESPTEELMMGFLMAAGASGNIETMTMRAFSSKEADKIRISPGSTRSS